MPTWGMVANGVEQGFVVVNNCTCVTPAKNANKNGGNASQNKLLHVHAQCLWVGVSKGASEYFVNMLNYYW